MDPPKQIKQTKQHKHLETNRNKQKQTETNRNKQAKQVAKKMKPIVNCQNQTDDYNVHNCF